MKNGLAFAVSLLVLVGAAPPALAVEYPVSVTFIVPTTVAEYPVPPVGIGTGLGIFCGLSANGGGFLGRSSTVIPLLTTKGKQNFSGAITVKVTLLRPAHTGDAYSCDLEASGRDALEIGKGYKPATSVLSARGTLP